MEQTLVKLADLRVGDEIIIPLVSNLRYLKIVRLPLKKDSTRFKVSLKREKKSFNTYNWFESPFEQDVTKHNETMIQDLQGKQIFLVKRENN